MRMGTVALDAGRFPADALVTPGSARAVDLTAQLAASVGSTVRSGLRRILTAVSRQLVAVLRARGAAVVTLLTTPRAWPRAVQLVTAAGHLPGPQLPGESAVSVPRIPTQRPPAEPRRELPRSAGHHLGPVRYELALPADATAPGRARTLLQEAARAWDVDEEAHQDAAMVVTELVANAVDHACTESTLTLELAAEGLRVAVRDTRPGRALRARPVDPTAPRGRGLQMIEALAVAWGVTQDIGGKTVWAVLPRT